MLQSALDSAFLAVATYAGFCPHWSVVVGPNHHSENFTTIWPKKCSNRSDFDHHSNQPGQNPAYALTGGQVAGPDGGEIVILLTVEDLDALRMNDAIATSMKKKIHLLQ